ncbi:protein MICRORCHIDIA 6 [Daucus carota subsp. sativus]|uniref:protein MICRORCHIDIA 6 n=1 Tax=Daucus carota subsp. sativus TaxID=79200 RepID=UPI0007EFB139|nr:PREDICTED: protein MICRORCHIDIA 6-like [Daucus carota subsp. sativus]XP_017216540.1 PREDICTED: protein MICRORCHIDIA 6-like [Daucus carota subsp. sativus]
MSRRVISDLCSDQNTGEVVKALKSEPDLVGRSMEIRAHNKPVLDNFAQSKTHHRQEVEDNRSSSAVSTGQSGTSALDQEQSQFDHTSPCLTSPISPAPLCRQFWKAGKYDDGVAPKANLQNGTNHLYIHPKFLHSNATSHKWAFGAIAELIDNAVDEIQNGATFVIIDKTLNPKNGASALLIQDDGGGMDPEAMRRCLSFGFSDKKSKSAIGQYGNGFKTSSMRLGADVIVFSRHMKDRTMTQSIGLLSYTFLTQTGHNRIVVPMVDYEFNTSTGTMDFLQGQSKENYMHNLSILLKWSPYSSEIELLNQCKDIGYHGTKVIIYNLWCKDERNLELDFESEEEDILIDNEAKKLEKAEKRVLATELHIANRLHYSLRAYLSVLYLRLPSNFCMFLRGRVVEYHNIATDLKYPEFIVYKPHNGRGVEDRVITTIGFLKEAPQVNIYGFNVYHKNRLILPFWRPANYTSNRGRGVVGVLEANFIQPSHNKQDFEKTSAFQKLEVRLKEMTVEYWDHHCGFLGYTVTKKPRALMTSQVTSEVSTQHGAIQPVMLSKNFVSYGEALAEAGTCIPPMVASSNYLARTPGQQICNQIDSQEGTSLKRRDSHGQESGKVKRRAVARDNVINTSQCLQVEPPTDTGELLEDQEPINVMQENRNLHAQCIGNERTGAVLKEKVITHVLSDSSTQHGEIQPVMLSKSFSSTGTAPNAAGTCTPPVVASSNELARTSGQRKCNQIDSQEGARMKKRDSDFQTERLKRKAVTRVNVHDSGPCLEVEPTTNTGKLLEDQKAIILMQKNRELHAQCMENERKEAELKEKVETLRTELKEARSQYTQLLADLQWLEKVKVETSFIR